MSEISDFVANTPLFDTHEHQHGFKRLAYDHSSIDYRIFLGYAPADISTAGGVAPADTSTADGFFRAWQFVRTTGYGQATEVACKALLGLDFALANVPAINTALQQLIANQTIPEIYEAVFAKANVKWALSDECWDSPTDLVYFDGQQHPAFFRHCLRCDEVIAAHSRGDIQKFERACGRSIHRLSDLDRAMDDYAEKARQAGRLAAFKCGLAYYGTLQFENSSYAIAEPVFESVMQNRLSGDAKPLTSYLFHQLVRRAADFNLPLQIHTGYLAGNWGSPAQGDPNPLIPVFQRYRNVQFDLFHAGWPHSELMGAIGKAFPNVYLDMCWAWAMNPAGMERVLCEWLSAVPSNKIFAFGGDTGTPYAMLGYAIQARKGIAKVLDRKVCEGDYDLATARFVAERIMHENARELYKSAWSSILAAPAPKPTSRAVAINS